MDTQLKSNQINAILRGIQQKWFEIELKGREVGETEERNRIAQASQELQEQLGLPKAMIDTIIGVLIGKGIKQ